MRLPGDDRISAFPGRRQREADQPRRVGLQIHRVHVTVPNGGRGKGLIPIAADDRSILTVHTNQSAPPPEERGSVRLFSTIADRNGSGPLNPETRTIVNQDVCGLVHSEKDDWTLIDDRRDQPRRLLRSIQPSNRRSQLQDFEFRREQPCGRAADRGQIIFVVCVADAHTRVAPMVVQLPFVRSREDIPMRCNRDQLRTKATDIADRSGRDAVVTLVCAVTERRRQPAKRGAIPVPDLGTSIHGIQRIRRGGEQLPEVEEARESTRAFGFHRERHIKSMR